ncbi:M50 family metallopeptidase [Candidatus Roizmanbacteria bacterium]|nr:M50 family metallopeptidase [Candidatus Roizmanbacteria bacterium]
MALILFFIQLIALYFVSRVTIQELFHFFQRFIKSERVLFVLMSVLFFPGTLFHEAAHLFVALLLLLKVREIKIFPELEDGKIKLGKVTYEKRDFVRGIVVGIAPILSALFLFWFFAYFKIFPQESLLANLFLGYIVFTVSSTMFSSRQDLVDVIYVIPFAIFLIGVFYIFDIRLQVVFQNKQAVEAVFDTVQQINFYLLFSLLINLFGIIVLKAVRSFLRK